MRWIAVLVTLAGCGRIGFAPLDGDGDAIDAGGAGADAPLDQPSTWTLLQVASTGGETVTVNPTMAGSMLVVAAQVDLPGVVTSVTDDSGSSAPYQSVPSSRCIANVTSDAAEMWFTPNVGGGATSVTVTIGGGGGLSLVVWELAGPPTRIVDDAAALDDQPANAVVAAPVVTTPRDGAFIVAITVVQFTAVSIVANNLYVMDSTVSGNGWAHLPLSFSFAGQYEALWNQSQAGGYCASAATFALLP